MMAKRGKKQNEILNPFEQCGDRQHRPSRPILFDDDGRNDVWLDALEAFDRGDKSDLVALLNSGYSIPAMIIPHIGDVIDRHDFKKPAHKPRKPSYVLTDNDMALSSADAAVIDLMSKGCSLDEAIAAIANKRGISVSLLIEHHARRRRVQRKR